MAKKQHRARRERDPAALKHLRHMGGNEVNDDEEASGRHAREQTQPATSCMGQRRPVPREDLASRAGSAGLARRFERDARPFVGRPGAA
jgi:hypothetical protein